MEAIFIIMGVLAVIGAIVAWGHVADRKRSEELEKVAIELGLEFLREGCPTLQSELSQFALFNSGRAKKLTKLIRGASDEVAISIFDYTYTTGGGKNSQTHSQTVAAIRDRDLLFPSFTMRTESVFDKIGGMIGLQDFDFDSHPKFSGMFVLKGTNEAAVRQLFNEDVLSFFESKQGLSVEAGGGGVIIYRPRVRVAPGEIKGLMTEAYQVYGALADSVAAVKKDS